MEFDIGSDDIPTAESSQEALMTQSSKEQKFKRRFPLHHLVASKDPNGTEARDIDVAIHAFHRGDCTLVHSQDQNGFTPLHIAAKVHHFHAAQTLLELPPESGVHRTLFRRDNVQGLTPLEACEREMRSTRESSELLSSRWGGYREAALKTVSLLKRGMGETIAESNEDFVNKRKWGCTCGRCLDGFLSPRMRRRVLCEFHLLLPANLEY